MRGQFGALREGREKVGADSFDRSEVQYCAPTNRPPKNEPG